MWWRGSSGIRVLSVTSFRQFELVESGGAVVRGIDQKGDPPGAFVSVPNLIEAIETFLAAWNESPALLWTATVENIVAKIQRARAKLEQLKPAALSASAKSKLL